MRGWQPDDEDWSDIRRGFLSGAAAGLVVVVWMWLAHPGEETISSRGFDMGGGFAGSPLSRPSGPSMIFAKREPAPAPVPAAASVANPSSPLPFAGAAPAPAPTASAASDVQAPEAAAAPSADAPARVSDPKDLAKAGLPTDAKGLAGLGARKGMLSAVVEKFLAHPAVLKAVFNNKLVVDAFMNRDVSKRNCSDAGALKSYLSDSQSAGMTKVFPVLQTVLSHPAAAASLAGTEMARRVMECPSVQTISNDKTAVRSIMVSNPQAMMLLADPRLTAVLTSNPQASSLLSGLTGGGAQK